MTKIAVLIDDDQDDLEFLQEAIQEADRNLIVKPYMYCDDAIQEIVKTWDFVPDYIFIDVNMPKIRGDECLQQLRLNPKFDNSTITMFSTSMPNDVSQKLKKHGANYAFEKPLNFAAYQHILKKVLSTD